MKVEIKLQPDLKSSYVVIYTGGFTTEVHCTAAILVEERTDLMLVEKSDKIVMLHPERVCLIRVENEKTVIYTAKKQYQSNRRLYELGGVLGRSFMRIPKSAIMNLQLSDYAASGLGGIIILVLENGLRDHVSRRYLPDLKRYLGL